MSKCRYGTQIKGEYGTRPILCALQNGARCEDWPPDRCWRYQCAAKEAAEERVKALEAASVPDEMGERTFSVHRHVNCPKPYCVKLIRPGDGQLDTIPGAFSKDCLGFGMTL